MMCPALPADDFLSTILQFIDCKAQTIGANGYQALSASGSNFSFILAGLLTLFIALHGYRMMLGHVPSVREGVLAFVKIGIVLVLATNWAAYRTLVYDTVFLGPAELSVSIGGASTLPGTQGDMVSRLEATDRALVAFAIAGAGQPVTAAQAAERMPSPIAGFEAFALGGARIIYLFSIVAGFAAVRLVAGLLLALAPLFFAFVLFDATRGLFEGWLRVLAGSALGTLSVSIVLGVELALLEPWLTSLLAARAANIAVPSAPVELLVVATLFGIALAVVLRAVARLAMGFQFPMISRWTSAAFAPYAEVQTPNQRDRVISSAIPTSSQSRAVVIADAVASAQRRETSGSQQDYSGSRVPVQAADRAIERPVVVPLSQGTQRRMWTRVSSSAGRRDGQS